MKTLLVLLLLGSFCLAGEEEERRFVRFTKDSEVLVTTSDFTMLKLPVDKGDVFLVEGYEYKKLTDYVSDTSIQKWVRLKIGEGIFTELLGTTEEKESDTLTSNDKLGLVKSAEIDAAEKAYKDEVKEFRQALAERRRSDDADAILRGLRAVKDSVDIHR